MNPALGVLASDCLEVSLSQLSSICKTRFLPLLWGYSGIIRYFLLSHLQFSFMCLQFNRRSWMFCLSYRYFYRKIWGKDIFCKEPKIPIVDILAKPCLTLRCCYPRWNGIASLRTQHSPFAGDGLHPSIPFKHDTCFTNRLLWPRKQKCELEPTLILRTSLFLAQPHKFSTC